MDDLAFKSISRINSTFNIADFGLSQKYEGIIEHINKFVTLPKFYHDVLEIKIIPSSIRKEVEDLLESIMITVKDFFGVSNTQAISADELLPLTVISLVLTKPRNLVSAMYYVCDYSFSSTEDNYGLTTLSAATKFIVDYKFPDDVSYSLHQKKSLGNFLGMLRESPGTLNRETHDLLRRKG